MLGVYLVDVFTAVSTNEMCEMLLKEVCKTNSVLRLLMATTEMDCADIVHVIYYPHKNSEAVKKWCGLKKPG